MKTLTLDMKPDARALAPYRKKALAWLEWHNEPFAVQTKEGALEIGPHLGEWEDGYWVCWPDDGTEPYPISPQYVRDNYELA